MTNLFSSIQRFLSELRRRNVYRVAVTYVVVGFFVIEGADLVLTRLGLPPWTVTFVIVLVGLGFPIALVLAWALEMTPEGVRVEETEPEEGDGAGEVPASVSPTQDLWVGASVLALLLLGVWWMWGGFEGGAASEKAGKKSPETKDRSIAVLPFEVTGAGAKDWRDGMVTMLSMNLDGAAGLRAISERTVLAAWERRDSTRVGASTRKALAVARDIGAKYAILGSAVQLGEELRLGVEVRRVDSGRSLGEVEVEGSPGDVTALTDRLTRKVLGILLDRSEEAIPSVDLASITTESLPALKDYLEGERHFRAGKFEAAIEDYEAAVEKDSAFALAYSRLATSYWWQTENKKYNHYLRRAHALADRLPKREREVVEAAYLRNVGGRALSAADTLRRLTKEYPDDPTVWYQLGETLFHNSVPRGWPEADAAFGRAVDLDPGMAPYHHHYVDLALGLHHDSALAAQRIAAHPSGYWKRASKNNLALLFGSPKHKQEILAGLDSLPVIPFSLQHPADRNLWIRALGPPERVSHDNYLFSVPGAKISAGRVEGGIEAAHEASWRPADMACLLAYPLSLSMPVPDSLTRHYLEPGNLPKGATADQLKCAGLYLAIQGRGEALGRVISRFRASVDKTAPGGPSVEQIDAIVQELRGYRALRADSLRRAKRLLSRSNESLWTGAIWRGDLYRKLGELKGAEGWYLAAWRHPLAHERLGRLYEEMGRSEKAKAAYRRFIEAWKNADPELQDRVAEARERLEALRENEAAE